MRVTESSKKETVLNNIQKSATRLRDLQSDLATGQKINRISDDPIGATVMQDVITSVSRSEQIKENIDTNIAWLEQNEVELKHISELLGRARSLVVSQAGGSSGPESRMTVFQELSAIKETLFDTANAKQGKLYLFSGTKTLTKPLVLNGPIQKAKVYTDNVVQKDIADLVDLTQFDAQFEGYSANTYRVRISETGTFGSAKYKISEDGGKTWGNEALLLPTIPVRPAQGFDDKITLKFSKDQELLTDLFKDLDDGFAATPKGLVFPEGFEFVFSPNPNIGYKGNNQKKEVLLAGGVSIPINVTAEELFLKSGEGSVNVFDVINVFEKALQDSDDAVLADRIGDLDTAMNQVLQKLSDIGNSLVRLENTKQKMDDQIFSQQKRLAEVRDVDLAKSMIELNSAEAENKVSMGVGGKLLQTSLLDFLR